MIESANIYTTRNKALNINRAGRFYGSFAEIGAGQEVARHFFQAGLASQTIAKSMSAYDKAFSDSIYGKGSRFVSEDRLLNMLEHEYNLLGARLPLRVKNTCFFSFANTVATSSHEEVPSCHGWMGVRFQLRPEGPINDVVIHVRMLDRLRLQQQDSLGVLGVNLLFATFNNIENNPSEFIKSLADNLSNDRIEINFIRFFGPDVEHIDSRLMSLELVEQNLTRAILFSPKGASLSLGDTLYKKPVLVQRGSFRPVTLTNQKITENGLRQAEHDFNIKAKDAVVLMEMTMTQLINTNIADTASPQAKDGAKIDKKDFLDRIDTLCSLNHHVLISNFPLFAQLLLELRRFTDQQILTVIGATALKGLFDENNYSKYSGGILSAFGHLFGEKSCLYVYPYKTDTECLTAGSYHPSAKMNGFYQYLKENKFIVDMRDCDHVDTSLHSEAIRKLLSAGNPKWEELVPTSVCALIKKRKLFGYKG